MRGLKRAVRTSHIQVGEAQELSRSANFSLLFFSFVFIFFPAFKCFHAVQAQHEAVYTACGYCRMFWAGNLSERGGVKNFVLCRRRAEKRREKTNMEKMIKCKTCGADIAKTAKVCPNCGAKQKKHAVLGVILVIFGVLLIVAAIGGSGSDEPKKVGDPTPTQSQGAQSVETSSAELEKTTFGVGEQVSLNDVIVTLNGVTESNGSQFNKPSAGNVFILCEFTIENNSERDLGISSIMCFEAYVDDYSTSMSLSATIDSDKNQLDGTVAAGKKMNGVIGYEAAADWSEIEIRFTPDFWSGKDITFIYSK